MKTFVPPPHAQYGRGSDEDRPRSVSHAWHGVVSGGARWGLHPTQHVFRAKTEVNFRV